MSDLDDDIARIARLRGHDPALAARKAAQVDSVHARLSLRQIDGLFRPGRPRDELAALDSLPAASRSMVAESPVNLSAAAYCSLLDIVNGREAELLALVRPLIEQRRREMARRHFGDKHPDARMNA